MSIIIYLFAGIGIYAVQEHVTLFFRRREKPRFEKKWNPPARCKLFGHEWKPTEYALEMFLFISPIERCARCGCARHETPVGYAYRTPAFADEKFAKSEAIEAGKVRPIR